VEARCGGFRRGGGELARGGLRRTYCHSVGKRGRRGEAGGRPAGGQVRSRRRREVGDAPDRWGPPVGEGGREMERGGLRVC
jgi:hypothetical protein